MKMSFNNHRLLVFALEIIALVTLLVGIGLDPVSKELMVISLVFIWPAVGLSLTLSKKAQDSPALKLRASMTLFISTIEACVLTAIVLSALI